MFGSNKITGSFLIGLFVIIGFGLLVGTIIWLGKTQFLEDTKFYVTYFDGSVEGLETGSPVKYLGVPVGTVHRVKVAPDGKMIEIIMQIDKSLDVDTNLRVKAEMAGLAGGKFLQLNYLSSIEMMNAYPKLTFEPEYEVIRSTPSGFEEIEIAMKEVMNNLRLLQVAEISNETLRFLESASYFFENEELFQIVAKLNDASIKFDNILLKADSSHFIVNIENSSLKLLKTSEELLDFGNQLNKQLADLQLTNKVDRAFAQFDSTIYGTRKIINVLGTRTEDILFTLNETLYQLQNTNKELRKAIRVYTDNPGQLLLSQPPPKEK